MSNPPASHRPLPHFADARRSAPPRERLAVIRRAAHAFREEFRSSGMVLFYRSFDLIRVPYPARYALRDACPALAGPFIHLLNRMFVIQYRAFDGSVKTLLVSPSDTEGNRETPFFKRLGGQLQIPGAEWLMAPVLGSVEDALARCGIRPEQVDYLTYDHLHTQDLRKWLGTGPRPGLFPNARLLVSRQEWASTHGLLPTQAQWYCPRGTEGVPLDRIEFFDGSIQLGEGLALVLTPGHTEGNHSIVAHTPGGVLVTSENGVSPDCYAPARSRIGSVRRYHRDTGSEVVLNGNTLESSVDQYLSMVLEAEIAGPCPANPDFPNVVPSSELTPYWLFPGIRPAFLRGPLEFGQPAAAARSDEAARA